MIQTRLLLSILLGSLATPCLFGQVKPQAPERDRSSQETVTAPLESLTAEEMEKKQDEVLAYRFYLDYPLASYDLVVSNPTNKPAFFTIRGQSPGTEGVPAPEHRTLVGPNTSVRVSAGDARWASFTWVLIDAPRRASLALSSGEGTDQAIPIKADRHARAFEVFTENRPLVISATHSKRQLALLLPGSNPNPAVMIEADGDLAAASRALSSPKGTNTRQRLYIVFDWD